jgi:hypothetical protein
MMGKRCWAVACVALWLMGGCGSKYDKAPPANDKETHAMRERYQALLDKARQVKPGDEIALLQHFSPAVLSHMSQADFTRLAGAFVQEVQAGKFDKFELRSGKAPGKVRLLLFSVAKGQGVVPFVQSADGWKMDDVELAFLAAEKDPELKGVAPRKPPSALASLSILQDPQASGMERMRAALALAAGADRVTAERFAAGEQDPWARTALLFAAWKGGAACEPFAQAFPVEGERQTELYEADSDAFRSLLKGLFECATAAKDPDLTLRIYQACHKVEGGPRSEYVDPVVELANAQPDHILQASLRARIPYDQDPVANIVVGALHGEQKSAFVQHVTQDAGKRGKTSALSRAWVEKMAERDKLEPPQPEGGPPP